MQRSREKLIFMIDKSDVLSASFFNCPLFMTAGGASSETVVPISALEPC